MSTKKMFSVAAIGVSDSEHKVLRNIFRLSQHRTRSYALAETSATTPDIALLDPNGGSTLQVNAWREQHPELPTVEICREPPTEAQPYRIRRPFVATRVLSVLDQVVIKELSYIPEMMIGSETGLADKASTLVSETVAHSAPRAQPVYHRALVVDDSLPVRKQMEIELKLLGVAADFAETGEDAFRLIERQTYDIIFLDVVLPGIDGYKLCRAIKKDKLTKTTPVVMLTSKSSPFDKIRGTFAGCNTYMTKPVSHDAFRDVIKQYLR